MRANALVFAVEKFKKQNKRCDDGNRKEESTP